MNIHQQDTGNKIVVSFNVEAEIVTARFFYP